MIMINDPLFKVTVLSKTERPNLISYLAMHQCVAENSIDPKAWEKFEEKNLGRIVLEKCIKFGHYSVIEHPTITFLVQNFPHEVMVQMTRHRHLSFSVQSQRYTGKRVNALSSILKEEISEESFLQEIEKLFYVRPVGVYKDREGKEVIITEDLRNKLLKHLLIECVDTFSIYTNLFNMPFEIARNILPQGIRQDFVVTMNARSLLHFLDLRTPKDAQEEIRTLAFMLFNCFKEWMPEIAEWYESKRLSKNNLAP